MTHEAAGDMWGVFKYCELTFVPKNPQKLCYSLFILQGNTTLEININLLVVYPESVNLIGYITGRLSADSLLYSCE